MTLTELIQTVAVRGGRLVSHATGVRVEMPPGTLTPELREGLLEHRQAIRQAFAAPPVEDVTKAEREAIAWADGLTPEETEKALAGFGDFTLDLSDQERRDVQDIITGRTWAPDGGFDAFVEQSRNRSVLVPDRDFVDPEMIVMPFGKHKGTPLVQVPQGYLAWLWQKSRLLKNHPALEIGIAAILR